MHKLLLSLLLVSLVAACTTKTSTVYTTDNGAIDGYDAVGFFKEGKPVKGDKNFSTEWNGATWCFSSAENLEAFKANPEQYAPQYGGYCAYGTADGHLSPTQADTWTIVDGKLYFNYNQDVKARWMQDQKGYIEKADLNWPALKAGK
ncbi:MAG: YHS domain-containing protein [Cyclobacteriaceae bacterium]|nr:YHS domain-containing protein [Cyclobacteriaceae bacterium]